MKNSIVISVFCALLTALSLSADLHTVSAQTRTGAAGNNIDKGDFKVGFSAASLRSSPGKKMPKEVIDLLNEIAKPLNETIALPYDVFLNFDKCGEPNAFYDPEAKEITMCYEFLEEFDRIFRTISEDEEVISDMTFGAMTVFFFHELGHCLIDVWDLPATGREEDAVDQLAMVVLLDGTREGENMVLSAATFFDLVSREQDNNLLAFWGVHSLDQQRFFDMLCLTYGSNPAKNKHLINDNYLPAERAGRCPGEYKRVDSAWGRLLTPYLKE